LVEFLKIPVDLSKEAEVAKAIEITVAKFGRIDYAVNNAAVGQRRLVPTSEASLEDFDRLMSVNFRGVFICDKYELKQMETQEPLIPKNHSA
jgi:NAD(P)-dependent dehydrogenase (short-subunit alcohol dehydrogenase family)